MNALRLMMLGLVLIAAQPVGAATPTQYGVNVTSFYADCSLALCNASSFANLLNFILPRPLSGTGGLLDTTAAELDVVHEYFNGVGNQLDMGRTSAQVGLDPTTPGAFTVGVEAMSFDFEGYVGALGFALAGFTYTGPPGTVDVSAALTGNITNPSSNDVTELSAYAAIVRDNGLMFPNPAPATLSELANFVFGLPLEELDDRWVDGSTADGAVNLSTPAPLSLGFTQDQIDMGLNNFYVVTAGSAGATDAGHVADAFATLTTTLSTSDPDAVLIPSVIPLPPAVWLFGSGLAGLIFIRRKSVY